MKKMLPTHLEEVVVQLHLRPLTRERSLKCPGNGNGWQVVEGLRKEIFHRPM